FLSFDLYAAFRWRPGASDVLSSQLVYLKGPRDSDDWKYWAARFIQRRLNIAALDRPIRIVPAPSSTGKRDHAFFWAKALSHEVGGDLFPCLKKAQSRKQRGSSLSERLTLQFDLDENNSDLPIDWPEVLWVFADDIVTTGSTALAAYKALGSPPHFEVWTLAKRTLSCGASTDLL
ncbi:MAG: ComF family protein, partial [Bacillota bacterium]